MKRLVRDKVLKVIRSCKTKEQLKVALRYARLALEDHANIDDIVILEKNYAVVNFIVCNLDANDYKLG